MSSKKLYKTFGQSLDNFEKICYNINRRRESLYILIKGDKTLDNLQETKETQPADGGYIKMDFSIEDPAERVKKVEEIIANTPPERLTQTYLEKLSDYIIFAMDKEEKKQKKILTKNHLVATINKREISFEGLVGKLENGEDGIYNLITNDKNIIFTPKVGITDEDLENIPGLRELQEEIAKVEEQCKTARGKRAYALRKQLIEMRKDQYVYKNLQRKPVYVMNVTKSLSKLDLGERVYLDEEQEVKSTGLINLFNTKHVSALLCNYSQIKEDCWDKFNSDIKWLMEDLDSLVDSTLKDKYPLYYDLVIYKIDGKSNAEIQEQLKDDYGIKHSVEYISSLWRNKIPKMIADKAAEDQIIWHYTNEEYGPWKKCGRCGQFKIAHHKFFSKNKTSKDGWYSICKCCRNKKG